MKRGEESRERQSQLRLMIIIASTRPTRVGLPVGRWFFERARNHGGFQVELVDLKELDLPLLDETQHPRLGQYEHEHTKRWSGMVEAADAFVFVMPEYNHGFTAPLKNAIDFLYREWRHKPVGFVSYGGVAGGTRAVQMLKPVLAVLRMVPVPEAVVLPFVSRSLGDDGEFVAEQKVEEAAERLLIELRRMSEVLSPLRQAEVAAE